MHSDTYRDNSKHCVDDSSADGGVDGLRYTSVTKDACGVVKDLKEERRKSQLILILINKKCPEHDLTAHASVCVRFLADQKKQTVEVDAADLEQDLHLSLAT